MRNSLKARGAGLAVAVLALSTLATPAWALVQMPAPAAGGLAGLAIVGAIVIAKLWRRK